jgi:hypothetical protein
VLKSNAPATMPVQARRLKKLVETVLGWSLETETEFNLDDEYAPVVVPEEDAMLVES